MLLTSITPKQYKYYTGGCKSAFFRYNNSVEGAISTRYLLGNYCTWRSREAKGERRGGALDRGTIAELVALAGLVSEEVGLVGEREYLTGKTIQQQSCLILLTFNLIFLTLWQKLFLWT